MKKLLVLFLLVAGFWGCESEKKSGEPFVTDVVIPAAVADPGSEVRIAAKGFDQNDDIFVRQGQSILRAEVTHVEYSEIRFIAPGGLPAGTAEVLLMRSGEYMVLGQLKLSDGLPPKEYSLYGIDREGGLTSIRKIDMQTGAITPVAVFDEGQDLRCLSNAPGTNRIFGVNTVSGKRTAACYDLTTKRFQHAPSQFEAIMPGSFGSGAVGYLFETRTGYITLGGAFTRSNAGGDRIPEWQLPEAITPAMLTDYPFVSIPEIMLAARTSEGHFTPVLLYLSGSLKVLTGKSVEADSFVPFRIVRSIDNADQIPYNGGYAVAREGKTELRLLTPAMELDELLAEVPGTVISCTGLLGTRKLYLLSRTDEGTRVYLYDGKISSVSPLTEVLPFSEIVLAR